MTDFRFSGEIEASKSLMNRALVIQSFDPRLQMTGESQCDDVVVMRAALKALSDRRPIDCGDAGTVIRFLGPRVSREPGSYFLAGSPRLLSRPMQELTELLQNFGITCEVASGGLRLEGQGWQKPKGAIHLRRDRSSQFASGLLLSSWNLNFDLELQFEGPVVSEAYWQMTVSLVEQMGMEIEKRPDGILIPSGQRITSMHLQVEPDYSSMFVIAAAGALFGESQIENADLKSVQPDFAFIQLLREMQAEVRQLPRGLGFAKSGRLKAVKANLLNAPDLFPVLAVVCAFADGQSELMGAPHLKYKESDRLQKTLELLGLAGVTAEIKNDGLSIQGQGLGFMPVDFHFDPDQDHRMAMAAGLLQLRNPRIQIATPQVVDKSFPNFWTLMKRGQS